MKRFKSALISLSMIMIPFIAFASSANETSSFNPIIDYLPDSYTHDPIRLLNILQASSIFILVSIGIIAAIIITIYRLKNKKLHKIFQTFSFWFGAVGFSLILRMILEHDSVFYDCAYTNFVPFLIFGIGIIIDLIIFLIKNFIKSFKK